MEILVASCDRRRPLWPVWAAMLRAYWPDCPFPWRIISNHVDDPAHHTLPTGPDEGWCLSIDRALARVQDPLVLLCLDDDFFSCAPPIGQDWTKNLQRAVAMMEAHPDVGSIACSPAAQPELPWPHWNRLGEIDRAHHPFKRTTPSSAPPCRPSGSGAPICCAVWPCMSAPRSSRATGGSRPTPIRVGRVPASLR